MKANSWDCFDTLIARNLITPSSIFDIVGKKIGDPDFTYKRKKFNDREKIVFIKNFN